MTRDRRTAANPTMPLSSAPRSVSDATRFTATTPHASSKADVPPRFAPAPRSSPGAAAATARGGGPGLSSSSSATIGETPEQKVARLRAAHLRAKAAQVSRFDKFLSSSRWVLDKFHRVAVAGIVGFTLLAGVATAYTFYDMLTYNKKRTAEWVEAQKRIEADSLEAARLAYMTNKATEEQIALVEEQLERERESGHKTSFFSKFSVLGTPEPAAAAAANKTSSSSPPAATTEPEADAAWATATTQSRQAVTETGRAAKEASSPAQQDASSSPAAERPKKTRSGVWAWLTSNLKREEEGDEVMSPQRRLGWESLSEQDDGGGVRDSDIVRAVEDKQAALRSKARAAFEKEKENQRRGGPLDRVGLDHDRERPATTTADGPQEQPKKKGWW